MIRNLMRRLKRRIMPTYELAAMDVRLTHMEGQLMRIQQALGRLESRPSTENGSLSNYEFQVYSQFGEDGIIQHLVRSMPDIPKTFVEFGVEDYREANTRFLLLNDNWSGLIMDASDENVQRIRRPDYANWGTYWFHDLKVLSTFVTRDNINRLLEENGYRGELGLLSIDIDGMDYWIWETITIVQPAIVVIEYNYRLGNDLAVTVPYSPNFDRTTAHYSHVYFGASLKALCLLAKRKGYDFVGCSSAGINAFFVRSDKRPEAIRALTPEEGYVRGKIREAFDESGELKEMSYEEEHQLIMGLPLQNVE
jgi:hypothetical protein